MTGLGSLRRGLVGAALAGLSLATFGSMLGCATPGAAPVAAVVADGDRVVLAGERAFAVAELAYTVAANSTTRLAEAGLIRGATATRLRTLNATARAALVEGKSTADSARKAASAAQLFAVAAELDGLAKD